MQVLQSTKYFTKKKLSSILIKIFKSFKIIPELTSTAKFQNNINHIRLNESIFEVYNKRVIKFSHNFYFHRHPFRAFKLFKFPAQNLFYSTILFLWVRTIRLVNLQWYLLSIHVEKIVYQMNKASIISILGRNVGRYLKMTDTIPEGSSVTRLGFY